MLKRIIVFFSFLLMFWGCNQKKEKPILENKLKLPSLMVDASWLKGQLENDNLLVLDARVKKEYLKGHVPGAVNFPVLELNSTNSGQEKNLKSILEINKLFSQKGIRLDQTVVVYADEQMKTASRLF